MAQVYLGAATIGSGINARVKTVAELTAFLAPFHAHGHRVVDTARAYVPAGGEGSSEALLGEEGSSLQIDSKVTSFFAGAHKRDSILKSGNDIIAALKTTPHVLYLHAPDRATPFSETVAAMNELHKEGKFKEFGLSNYSAAEVQEIVDIARQQSAIAPTVYQGQYNALCRRAEKELFPTLRKNGIRFVGWSPLAGGILTGKISHGAAVESGTRFDDSDPQNHIASMYRRIYDRAAVHAAIDNLKSVAAAANLTPADVALRWTRYHSALTPEDALIIGASSTEQLERNLTDLDGGTLPQALVDSVNAIYEAIPVDDRPAYHF